MENIELQINEIPLLNQEELRVLGVLIEKSKTTPEYYPMTINAITLACNQKSSRKPIVNYTEQDVILTLDSLKKKGLINTMTGSGSRTVKYRHTFTLKHALNPDEMAVLCLLMLRGALTPGEINSNANRLYEFDSLEEVQQTLMRLNELKYVTPIQKQTGQKEMRYRHLLASDYNDINDGVENNTNSTNVTNDSFEPRIVALENEVDNLRQVIENIKNELGI